MLTYFNNSYIRNSGFNVTFFHGRFKKYDTKIKAFLHIFIVKHLKLCYVTYLQFLFYCFEFYITQLLRIYRCFFDFKTTSNVTPLRNMYQILCMKIFFI